MHARGAPTERKPRDRRRKREWGTRFRGNPLRKRQRNRSKSDEEKYGVSISYEIKKEDPDSFDVVGNGSTPLLANIDKSY